MFVCIEALTCIGNNVRYGSKAMFFIFLNVLEQWRHTTAWWGKAID